MFRLRPGYSFVVTDSLRGNFSCAALCWVIGFLLFSATALTGQVFRVDGFDPRLTPQPLHPTSLPLSQQKLTPHTRGELLRIMQSEEAFSLRALPLGRHGLVLHANGGLTPDGSDYQKAISQYGVSSKPGAKVIISDIHISSDRVVLELNGGPVKKHHWLQHIQVGGAGGARQLAPDEPDAVGSRVTLVFHNYVPEMTGQQLKALFSPLLDFSLKSPLQAYTDTLPPKIREAVKDHRVLVGMNHEMVLYSLTQPDRKLHEQDANGLLYEEWVYGKPPKDVQFIRFEGDRVTRVEIAAIGKEPIIRDKDETDGFLAGKQLAHEHTVNEGDAPASDPSQSKAPSLRRPGEPAPPDQPQRVQYPTPTPPAPTQPNAF
jgi:sulfur carrier protein ThiS